MDYQVVWSPEALADVEAIASYIARDSAAYARAVVEKILETARQLCEFPFLGRMVPESCTTRRAGSLMKAPRGGQ